MKIAQVDEVFTKYDLELLRALCADRKELHSNYGYPRREQIAIKKCIRLLDVALQKIENGKDA